MSIRGALVDSILEQNEITCFVNNRVFDRFYKFEDYVNRSGNTVNFPALTVELETWTNENGLNGHDNLIFASFRIISLAQINQQRLKSRNKNVYKEEKEIIRNLDNLNDAVTDYILDLSGPVGAYNLRKSHIVDSSDETVETEGNREIISREIIYEITYSK